MAYTKLENYTNQLQTNLRRPDRVQVCLSQDKEHIHIKVRDAEAKRTQAHEQHHVGSRHTDLHPASRDDSGLWFVISQTIVEWYNGRIRYTVSCDGEGYTCSIELPAS